MYRRLQDKKNIVYNYITSFLLQKVLSEESDKIEFVVDRLYTKKNREEFMAHCHQRSNVETTFMMVKTKSGDKLKSKNWIAQKNELLCKLIAHNIVVLIHEMHELGINPDFTSSSCN